MDLGVVDCVISYDPPKFVKNYIHRVGRTARAGRTGTAITLLSDSEVRILKFKCTGQGRWRTPISMILLGVHRRPRPVKIVFNDFFFFLDAGI